MPYTVTQTELPGVLVLEPRVFQDERGFFLESFNARDFTAATGLVKNFVQDNHSKSVRNVLRGLHFQIKHPQGKLVRVTEGEIYDVVVDLRRSSDTFGNWVGVSLSSTNMKQLWVPEGFAHGFLVTSPQAQLLYKTTDYWTPEYERSLLWSDPTLGIEWPLTGAPVLAKKDQDGLMLADSEYFE